MPNMRFGVGEILNVYRGFPETGGEVCPGAYLSEYVEKFLGVPVTSEVRYSFAMSEAEEPQLNLGLIASERIEVFEEIRYAPEEAILRDVLIAENPGIETYLGAGLPLPCIRCASGL